MTPYEIELLLHYHVSNQEFARADAPIYESTMNGLCADGLMEWVGEKHRYEITGKGEAHISQLCSLPYPKQQWAREDGAVINMDI